MDPENLDDILKRLPEVTAIAIVSMEGLPIASALPQGFDENRVSALIASLHSLSKQSINEMKKGELNQLYIKGSDGYLLVRPAGHNALLAISTTKDVRLGLIFSDLRSAGGAYEKINALMEKESVSEITIERQYLPEILSERYLKISSDGFPMLKKSVAENLLLRGIRTEYYGTVVRFLKNTSKPFWVKNF